MTAEEFLNESDSPTGKKLSAAAFLDEETQVGTSIGDTLQKTAEELEAGIGRAGSAFAKSAVGSVRMITDLFGANNAVSKEIAGVEDYIDQFTTAQAKQDKEEISRLFQEAEGKGLGNKVMAGLKAVAVSPETLGPEIAGYMFPSLAAGLLTGGASIPVQIGAQATVGAAQAAGSIKGDIYQSVRDYSREQGLSEIEADRAATEAQSYGGKNLDLILTNAGIGALAASTGAERIATRILTGRGQAVTKKTLEEFLKQGVVAGGVEAGTEGFQEAAEQISKNIADQRQGKDVPTFQNVPQVATMGAVAGGIIGGGLKGVEFLSAEEKEERDINRSAEMESKSLSATDATTKKVINDLNQSENAINSLRDELDTLEPTDPRAQQLRMQISEEQKKATGLKQSIGEEFLSEPITEAEKQQIELAKAITEPAPEVVAPVSEVAPEVAAPVTEAITPPAEVAPTTPVAAPAAKAPAEPPVSMVGKQVIPGVTPVPVVAKAPTEPTVKESLTVAPVEEEPFGKLPTAEAETALSQRTKEATIAEEREKIEAPIRRQESINQFLSEGATVKSRTNVVGRKKAAEGGGDITKTAYYLAHPDGKREIPLSKKEASDLKAPAITPAPVEEVAPATEIKNEDKLISENQLVGTSPDFMIVRDLYQRPDGSRYSIPKSSSIPLTGNTALIKLNRELTAEQLIEKYPVEQIKPTTPPITPAPVAETPAVAPAPEVAPAQRDLTKPEQMTEEEILEKYKVDDTQLAQLKEFINQLQEARKEIKKAHEDITRHKEKWDVRKNKKGELISYDSNTLKTSPNNKSAIEEFKLLVQKLNNAQQKEKIIGKQAGEIERAIIDNNADIKKQHKDAIKYSLSNKQPVSVAAVEAYNITIPEGYTKQGDLYVYQPTPAVSETITPEVAPTIEEQVIAIVPPETLAEIDKKFPNLSKFVRKNTPLFNLKASYLSERKKTTKITNTEIKAVMDNAEIQTPLQIENALSSLLEETKETTKRKELSQSEKNAIIEIIGKYTYSSISEDKLRQELSKMRKERANLNKMFESAKKKGNTATASEAMRKMRPLDDSIKRFNDARKEIDAIYATPAVSETIMPEVAPAEIEAITPPLEEKPAASEIISPAKSRKSLEGATAPSTFSLNDEEAIALVEIVSGKTKQDIYTKETQDAIRPFLNSISKEDAKFASSLPIKYIPNKVREIILAAPAPAVSETITPAEPEGISVGNRIKLGKSPQTYIVEEAIPKTEAEKANNEQFYSVKNERTGETQVVEKADIKKVGGKRARKMVVEVIPKQESVTPIPEANRYTFEEAVKAVDAHFGKKGIPEGVVIVNNTTEPDLEMKAGYFVNRGQIVINLAYIAKGENLGDIIDHELGHYIFGDPKFQADFKKFWELMTPEEKAKADQIINQFYNKETGAIQMEEKQVRAFMQLIQDSKAMPKWKQLLDKIKRWINEKLGTNLQVTDRGALAVLAAAHKRFKSGEQIIREIDSGVLKTAETAQDAEYLAAVERGDMETAQRMVDEAAKKAGYFLKAFHGSPEKNITQFKNPTWVAKDRNYSKGYAEKYSLNEDYDLTGEITYQGQGKVYDFFVKTDKTLKLWKYKDWVDLVEKLDPNNDKLKSAILEFQPVQNKIKTWENFKKETFKYREEFKKTGQEYFAWNTDGHDLSSTWQEYNVSDANFINKIKLVNALFDLGFDTLGQIESSEQPKTGAAYLVKNPSKQLKSADPVTYDDAGNVIPLSQRFQPSEPDIRRMAVEPTGEREQIMGEKIGPLKKTPEGIIAETQAKLRERFDPTKVTEQNTTEAFRALGRLTGKDGTTFAQELNDIGRMVDESGAASEVSMGAALFVNDLFEYAVRLAAQGQKMMLGIMMTNINKLPTGTEGRSDAGRALRAAREMKDTFLTMAKAEQDAFINYAAEFVYGPNPTKQQVDSIKIGYDAVEKVQEPTAKEVEEEIAAVGEKTGTDLVGRINDEFTKATEKGQAKRKTESEDLDTEYKKVQMKAESEIEKLAKIQSDTPAFARQVVNEIRAIIANDLKQRPDMESKAQWKSSLVDKLQNAGVEPSRAERLADLVWRQHEINNLSREIDSINKAVEKGPISEIIKAIKETPLEQQQNPNWRYEVMRDYLRKAGLSVAQAERIAKLMDISLQKRFTLAKEQAFTDAISKTAPWKAGDVRSKRAFQQVIQAIRAGALDPSRNMASDIAAMNGWTGFTADQYKNLLKFDAILADEKTGELEKANAYKGVQDIISKSKLPIRARDVIGQYYDAQALSGIPTLTVNSFSPIAFAMRNAIVQAGSGTIKGDAKAIGRAATEFVDSIKSWANTVAFSFKNNVTVYSNVDYIVNDDNLLRLYRKGVDQFTKSKNAKERADGVKNMMIGMMDYVRRILNALDYGAIAALQNQNISKYAMAVMKNKGMNNKQANEVFAAMMKAKNDFYLNQIAIGTDKNKARILADEFYISSWKKSLEKEGVTEEKIKSAMDAAINDALSSVGRNRQSLDAFKEEATNIKDAGLASSPALWLLESVANAANRSDSQFIKIFSRVIYGFAIVPARVIRETAWFSPYGFVRIMVDAALKNRNIESRYAQSLGSDFQRQQRLNEAIAGTVALFGLMALRASSTDDPEDEDEFKIVFTGNGPQRKDDPQFYDSWYKAGNKPNSMIVSFGKTKFTLNMMRGFEAFTWPAMMLGALDDLEIRKKQKQQTNTSAQLEDAAIVAGFVFDAALRRGPYAFTTKSLFGTYGDIGVEGVAKGLTFPAKTLIPVLGTSLASNLSNFLNDPIDRRTLDGAVWSNIPFIGPAVAPKSLNAFGEPSLSTDLASKMFKLGVPIVYDIPTDRESIKLHELVLKQGGGPSIPTRNQLAQRLDRQPTNKEYEMFVREYGTILTTSMKKNYDKLFNAKPEFYSRAIERIGLRARDVAENKVRQAAKKP